MPETPTLMLAPLTKFRLKVALNEKRIRRADYARAVLALTLSDGTLLKLSTESEVLIAVRCLTSAAHAGLSPLDARAAEREAAERATTGVKVQ
jgi:hypothetical protein